MIRDVLKENGAPEFEWKFFSAGNMRDNLFEVEHDTLAVLGTFGHHPIKKALFGSKMELIQSNLPNNLLLVGERCCFSGRS
jgi:nucleotide-binding universal stress UspA family protein